MDYCHRVSDLPPWRRPSNWRTELELSVGWPLACWTRRWFPGHDQYVRVYLSLKLQDYSYKMKILIVLQVPIYQSEIAYPSIRGRITALQQFMLGIGAFVAGWIPYGTFVGLKTTAQWRVPLGIQVIPAVFLGISDAKHKYLQ